MLSRIVCYILDVIGNPKFCASFDCIRGAVASVTPKMVARNVLTRCIAFYNLIPIYSLKIHNWNAMHRGKRFFAELFDN